MNETLDCIEQLIKKIHDLEYRRDYLADMREEGNFPCAFGIAENIGFPLREDESIKVCALIEQLYTEHIKDMKEELVRMMNKAIAEESDID